ncbi:MAG: ankyrin repeat domain-containing protein [Gemmatimonas sp.]
MKKVDPIHAHAATFLRAVRDSNAESAKTMLEAHPAIAQHSIHTASAIGDADAVASWLATDARLATLPSLPDGTEPIIYAAHAGLQSLLGVGAAQRVRTVQLLLDAGASANAFRQLGDDPKARIAVLYFACTSDNVEVARLLLERGAAPNDGESVYHAAEQNHRECLALLLSHGAEISAAHAHWGNTPLYFLAAYKDGNPQTVTATLGMQWLLEHGADPNVPSAPKRGADGTPSLSELPLHRIAAYGRGVDVAQMLVEHGAHVDAARSDGHTAYSLALRNGNTAVAAFLAQRGARTDMISPVDRLMAACAGARETEARDIAAAHPGIISTLTPEDRQLLNAAVEAGNEAAVRLMHSLDWTLSDESEWGGTPLHWAAWNGRVRMVRLLLELGAPVNVRDSEYGSSPIAWTAHGSTNCSKGTEADYVAIAELLLDAGSTRAESFNQWNEAPESMASEAVARVLKQRGFTATRPSSPRSA